jgi:starch synthase
MYGLRYGTVPVVRRVGGLADTVHDAGSAEHPAPGGNGFVFDAAAPHALAECVARAIGYRRDAAAWAELMRRGMAQDLSWRGPAEAYRALYAGLVGGDASAVGHVPR